MAVIETGLYEGSSDIELILIGCEQMFAGDVCSKETAQMGSALVS